MRFVFILSLCLFISGSAIAVEIKNSYFRLALPGDWKEQKGSSPEQFIITSESRKAQVTVSYVPMNAKGRNLEEIANKLLEIRFEVEHEVDKDRKVSLGEPWHSKSEDGSIQVNYMGHDSLGRHFFYTGFITESHTVSVTGELEFSNQPALHCFYQEVLSNFGY